MHFCEPSSNPLSLLTVRFERLSPQDHSHTETIAHLCGPVRNQLLGSQPGGSGATFSPANDDVPLAAVADACGILRPPPSISSAAAVQDATELQLAKENALLRAENALLRAAASRRRDSGTKL